MTFLAGSLAALHYARAGLALSHYDARAHLVVARRILDGITPGWQQIGAVWLPLPHLLNMLPVQVDALYRTGASGIAISVMCTAITAWGLATLLVRLTRSVLAAATGAALLLANPNLLYLQSTPMTEPLLFATTMTAVVLTARWVDEPASAPPRAAGWALVAACMTRYEAWPIAAALMALAGAVRVTRGDGLLHTARACTRLAMYPAIAIAVFMLNSRWTIGEWFVTGGFFVAENEALGNLPLAWQQVREGVYRLSGTVLVWSAYAAVAAMIGTAILSPRRRPLVLLLALFGAAALPLYAYYDGHPFRIRYSLPLVAACAAAVATGVALLPARLRGIAAAAVVAGAIWQASPLDRTAPLIVEARRDARNQEGRRVVTDYLVRHYDGGIVMMSMGSLAHYMHDLSRQGFAIRDFLHEGNGELWMYAVQLRPRGFVRWVAIEEQAEGGDILAHHAGRDAHFLDGFDRVAEGGGVALYRAR